MVQRKWYIRNFYQKEHYAVHLTIHFLREDNMAQTIQSIFKFYQEWHHSIQCFSAQFSFQRQLGSNEVVFFYIFSKMTVFC